MRLSRQDPGKFPLGQVLTALDHVFNAITHPKRSSAPDCNSAQPQPEMSMRKSFIHTPSREFPDMLRNGHMLHTDSALNHFIAQHVPISDRDNELQARPPELVGLDLIFENGVANYTQITGTVYRQLGHRMYTYKLTGVVYIGDAHFTCSASAALSAVHFTTNSQSSHQVRTKNSRPFAALQPFVTITMPPKRAQQTGKCTAVDKICSTDPKKPRLEDPNSSDNTQSDDGAGCTEDSGILSSSDENLLRANGQDPLPSFDCSATLTDHHDDDSDNNPTHDADHVERKIAPPENKEVLQTGKDGGLPRTAPESENCTTEDVQVQEVLITLTDYAYFNDTLVKRLNNFLQYNNLQNVCYAIHELPVTNLYWPASKQSPQDHSDVMHIDSKPVVVWLIGEVILPHFSKGECNARKPGLLLKPLLQADLDAANGVLRNNSLPPRLEDDSQDGLWISKWVANNTIPDGRLRISTKMFSGLLKHVTIQALPILRLDPYEPTPPVFIKIKEVRDNALRLGLMDPIQHDQRNRSMALIAKPDRTYKCLWARDAELSALHWHTNDGGVLTLSCDDIPASFIAVGSVVKTGPYHRRPHTGDPLSLSTLQRHQVRRSTPQIEHLHDSSLVLVLNDRSSHFLSITKDVEDTELTAGFTVLDGCRSVKGEGDPVPSMLEDISTGDLVAVDFNIVLEDDTRRGEEEDQVVTFIGSTVTLLYGV
ncbi:hypothetical protein NM688_g1859 [Phlebia brevispora]|uniref:Uncharacterized protein n=1 Tax=Phlebia brevispora TaxID=194682 RepID=A0ACC1T9W8_9APHY|nr:hypothetical protein NM688_g1859 [Phlebia brevispora]